MIRLNSILNNSENKIQAKFFEALGLKESNKNIVTSVEMVENINKFFEDNEDISVLFIFEDIEHYVESTKQLMLYKILDVLTQVSIKFVFLFTSMKYDVADNFEKRIKSRYSHRIEMTYGVESPGLVSCIKEMIEAKKDHANAQQSP